MTKKDHFHQEDRIIEEFEELVSKDEFKENSLLPELKNLLGHYKTLAKKFERITKVSDKQHMSLHEMTKTDALTGLNNRKHLELHLKFEWQRCAELNVPMTVMMLDIDHFKLYNDHYGHPAGDECLKQVASILASNVKRSSDFVARYGGEEFTLVLGNSDPKFAEDVATAIKQSLEDKNIPHAASKVSDHVTVSIGMVTFTPGGDLGLYELVEEADKALYGAKENGRNQFYVAKV